MSVYTYPQSKVIDEVTLKKSEGGHTRAYLHAAADASAQTLNDIICQLADHDWQVTPYSLGSKPVLEVHGFQSEKQLTDLLEEKGWVQGEHTYKLTQKDKLSVGERIKKRSLAASGLAYVVGDASFATYGYKDHSHLNLAAGILYGAGTVSLLGGGRKDPSDLQVRDISNKMAQHFRKLKIDLPSDCSLSAIIEDHHKGVLQKADELWRRYPSELMNMFFAAAGTCIAIAAFKSKGRHIESREVDEVLQRTRTKFTKRFPTKLFDEPKMRVDIAHKMEINHKRESWLDIGLGAMTGLSGLFAMSIKEKAHDPDAQPKHGLEAAWEWIREKPLAIAGVGYMVSTMCHAVSTTLAWNYASNERRKSVPFRALFVAANLVAEVLLAISSKGHGEGVKSDSHVDDTVISLAAELIVKQPKGMQEYLINHMSGFLGRPDVLAMKNEEVTKLLRTQVEAMRKNPWAQANGVEKAAAPPVQAPQAEAKPQLAAWQARTGAAAPAAPQPSR